MGIVTGYESCFGSMNSNNAEENLGWTTTVYREDDGGNLSVPHELRINSFHEMKQNNVEFTYENWKEHTQKKYASCNPTVNIEDLAGVSVNHAKVRNIKHRNCGTQADLDAGVAP